MPIASCLVDMNILLRMTRRSDPQHPLVDTALAKLASQGVAFHYTHQNIAELWNAMTRPLTRNGLGLTVVEAEREVQVHDARLAACMYVHGVSHILTLNVTDFVRFTSVTAVYPSDVR